MIGSAAGRPKNFLLEKIGRTAYWQGSRAAIASQSLGDASRGARTRPLPARQALRESPPQRPPRAAGASPGLGWPLSLRRRTGTVTRGALPPRVSLRARLG